MSDKERSRFERFLFSIMGPAQVGDPKAPLTYVPAAEEQRCAKCGHPWDEHERVHTGTITYRRCPA